MRRLLLIFACLSACACFAQTNRFPPINLYAGDPTGNACTGNLIQQSSTTGLIYTCQSGTMHTGGTTGNITPSPRFSMFYQPNAGTAAAAVGDPNITTDGSGHMAGASGTFSGNVAAAASITSATPYIDPRAFGAKEDCATDDSAALQAAINAGASTNSRVLISGCLAHASQINLPVASSACNWWIEGTGPSARIKATADMTYQLYRGAGTGTNPTCGVVGGLSNIILDSAQHAISALYIVEQHDLTLEKVTVLDATGSYSGTPATAKGEVQIGDGSGLIINTHVRTLHIDNSATIFGSNGIPYSGTAPAFGLYVGGNTTDSVFVDVLTAHNSQAGIYNGAGNNHYVSPHPWGNPTGGSLPVSWPVWGMYFDDHSFGTTVDGLEADTTQRAGAFTTKGFISMTNSKFACNSATAACTTALGQAYIIEAGTAAANISLFGYNATGAGINPFGSPIYWDSGTPDNGSTFCGQTWGNCQLAGRNGIHLASGSNSVTLDQQVTTGFANFQGLLQQVPVTSATSSDNVMPANYNNTASVWNYLTSAPVSISWSIQRFTDASTTAAAPSFDTFTVGAPRGQSWIGSGPRQFQVADLSTATALANYPPPDLAYQGACWNGSISKSESFFWRTTYGTGANPTETLSLFNTGNCSGAKLLTTAVPVTLNTLAVTTETAATSITSPLFLAGAGTAGAPSVSSSVDATTGFHAPAVSQWNFAVGGFDQWLVNGAGFVFRNTNYLRWASGGPSLTFDTCTGRGAAGVLNVGTSTCGNGLGTVQAAALLPGLLYSAAGTALPTCAVGIKGQLAVVSDATAPTYMAAYASGGAITAAVICSYNGATYSWLTH